MGIKKSKLKGLVIERLENVSKDVFSKYYPLIKELIGNYPGVYALYVDKYRFPTQSGSCPRATQESVPSQHLS